MFRIVSLLVAAVMATSAWGLEVNDRVENFRLLDHTGNSHELYPHYDNLDAIVFLVQGNGCPIVRNAAPRFAELRDEFADKNVKFFMLNTNLQDNRASISKEVEKFGYDIPILMDDTQIIGESIESGPHRRSFCG